MAAAENTAEFTPGTAPAAADSRLQQTLQNLNALSQRQKLAERQRNRPSRGHDRGGYSR